MLRISIDCLSQLWYVCEELVSNANRGSSLDVRNMHDCYMTTCVFLSHVRKVGMKSVTYWYQLLTRCEELVPTLHGVKFTKGEINGSTMPYKTVADPEGVQGVTRTPSLPPPPPF